MATQFIEKIKDIHGNKFKFDKFNYVNIRTKITLICSIHNEELTYFPKTFENPNTCCKQCRLIKDKESELQKDQQFKNSLIEKFGNKFDLSDTHYVNIRTPIKITCILHNITFSCIPDTIIKSKYGSCEECVKQHIINSSNIILDAFIDDVEKLRPDTYNFKLISEFKDRKIYIDVICKVHNYQFNIQACELLRKSKCCDKNNIYSYVNQAKQKFNNQYDYSNLNYTGSQSLCNFTCLIHKYSFQTRLYSHLNSTYGGCEYCIKENIINDNKELFIQNSKNKFPDQFDYSLIKYVDNITPIKLKCLIHNKIFKVKPVNHLSINNGCEDCYDIELKKQKNKLMNINFKNFRENAYILYRNQFTYNNYLGYRELINVECNICKNNFDIVARNHLRKKYGGCIKCVRRNNMLKYDFEKDEVIKALHI